MRNVLVVEDELIISWVVEDALCGRGLKVVVAQTGEEACARLGDEPRTFDALVTDINLGHGPSGFDVARRARELNPAIKIVYISGHAAHLEEAALDHALVIPKPFDADRLAGSVYGLLLEGA